MSKANGRQNRRTTIPWQKSRGGHPKERLKSVFTVGPTAGFSSSADQLLSLLSVHCTLVHFCQDPVRWQLKSILHLKPTVTTLFNLSLGWLPLHFCHGMVVLRFCLSLALAHRQINFCLCTAQCTLLHFGQDPVRWQLKSKLHRQINFCLCLVCSASRCILSKSCSITISSGDN